MKNFKPITIGIWISEFGGYAFNTALWIYLFHLLTKIVTTTGIGETAGPLWLPQPASVQAGLALALLCFVGPLLLGQKLGQSVGQRATHSAVKPLLLLTEFGNLALLVLMFWYLNDSAEMQFWVLVGLRSVVALLAGIHQSVRDQNVARVSNLSLLHVIAPVLTAALYSAGNLDQSSIRAVMILNAVCYVASIAAIMAYLTDSLSRAPHPTEPAVDSDLDSEPQKMQLEFSAHDLPPSLRASAVHLYVLSVIGGMNFSLFFIDLLPFSESRNFLPVHWTFAIIMTIYALGLFVGLRLGDRRVQTLTRTWFHSVRNITVVSALTAGLFFVSKTFVNRLEVVFALIFAWSVLLSFIGLGRLRFLSGDLSANLQGKMFMTLTKAVALGIFSGAALLLVVPSAMLFGFCFVAVLLSPLASIVMQRSIQIVDNSYLKS